MWWYARGKENRYRKTRKKEVGSGRVEGCLHSLKVDRRIDQKRRSHIKSTVLVARQHRPRPRRVDHRRVHVDADVPVPVVLRAAVADSRRVLGAEGAAVRGGCVGLRREVHVDGDVVAELLRARGRDPDCGVGVVSLLLDVGAGGGGAVGRDEGAGGRGEGAGEGEEEAEEGEEEGGELHFC